MLLVHILESDPRLQVIGAVQDGQAALDFIQENRPDVILMDIHMPGLDGFETTRRIMETYPVPIIICSATTNPAEVATTFRMMEAGAVACLEKPVGQDHPDHGTRVATLLQTVRLMAEVKVIRRWPRARVIPYPGFAPRQVSEVRRTVKVIGIGASTGGPPVLHTILSALPEKFPVPILVVQHIAKGFLSGLVDWLNGATRLNALVAGDGIVPEPGCVYLAPDDFHLGLDPYGRVSLSRREPENGLRPAVSYLFRSLAETYGQNAVGILLTGMGKDGAAELRQMKDKGSMTIVQDRESSVVHGMPGEAISLGAAVQILPASRISDALITIVSK